jgi:hypothetical protein
MPNTNDIDLQKLTLDSTFYDWYLRTNQIIDYINPINVYDVFAGNGLQESRTGTPGTVEISLGTDPTNYGIDTLTDSNGDSVTILNIAGLTSGTVANTSTFAFGGTGTKSVLRKVAASDMLPPLINGNHEFGGSIVLGDASVKDKTITLNYQNYIRDGSGIVLDSIQDAAVKLTEGKSLGNWYQIQRHANAATGGTISSNGTVLRITSGNDTTLINRSLLHDVKYNRSGTLVTELSATATGYLHYEDNVNTTVYFKGYVEPFNFLETSTVDASRVYGSHTIFFVGYRYFHTQQGDGLLSGVPLDTFTGPQDGFGFQAIRNGSNFTWHCIVVAGVGEAFSGDANICYAVDTNLDAFTPQELKVNFNNGVLTWYANGVLVATTSFSQLITAGNLFTPAGNTSMYACVSSLKGGSGSTIPGQYTIAVQEASVVRGLPLTYNDFLDTNELLNNSTLYDKITFLFDNFTDAWYSNRNLGLKLGKKFVSDSLGTAVYPFYATNSQGIVDIQLQTNIGATLEAWSIKGAWGSPDTLKFGHYTNGVLNQEVLELQSLGTNGSRVIVKDALTITDVLNSSPFSATPAVTSVPVTDATDGFLNQFVNRIKVSTSLGPSDVGAFVRRDTSTGFLVLAQANSEANAAVLGQLESVSSGVGTVITSGFSATPPTGGSPMVTIGIYYLSQNTAGRLQLPKPVSGIIKPVLYNLSTTTSLIIPDFYNAAGTSAFTAVQVVDTGETYTASASGTTLRLDGGNSIALDYTTNGTIVFNYTGSQLPTGVSNDSFYIKNNSGTDTALTPSTYSLVGQPLNAGLADIPVAPGTLVGRRDDTDDANNPVEALLPSQVRSILGFSGNRYIKSILFEESASTDIINFDATNSESVKVRAGFGIDFTYDPIEEALVITNTGGGTGGGGGPSTLDISATSGGSATDVGAIRFLNTDARNFIDFTVEENTSGTASIVATPKNTFLRLGNVSTINHDANDILRIVGTTGVNVSLASQATTNTFTISLLAAGINTNKVTSANNTVSLDTNSPRTLTFSVVDSSAGGGYNAGDQDYTVTLETYGSLTTISGVPRIDSQSYTGFSNPAVSQNLCISMLADKVIGPDTVSFPFRFYNIIADKIKVVDLEVTGTAIKDFTEINNLSGENYTGISPYNLNRIRLPTSLDGILLDFDTTTGLSNRAFIMKPEPNTFGPTRSKSFFISEKIFFTDQTLNHFSPSIGLDGAGSILVQSDSSQSKFRFVDSGNRECSVGVQSGYAFLTYDSDSTMSNSVVSFRVSADTILNNADSFAVGVAGTEGWKINTVVYSSNDVGKGVRISSVTGGVATLEARDYIKPYVAGSTSGDLINTLYYVV